MNSFTIKDVEKICGIKAHTIRIWEQRYSFLKPDRTGTNIRLYSNDDLKKILNISLLNKYGYKISHINKMSENEMKEKVLSLNGKEAQQEYIINELIQDMVDLNMDKFEITLKTHIKAYGIQKTIPQIIFPFLEKIGTLWLTNHINPAQEHLITNIIRQKLIAAIENIHIQNSISKTVLLFLPEGEFHELGLLFMNYLLKSKGVGTIYLGCSVPLSDMEYLVKLKKPDFLYCHLTIGYKNFNLEKFITSLSKKFPDTPTVISGKVIHNHQDTIPSSILLKKTLPEVMDFVSML
jgi:DNA-binding transcriptional MerR regulator